jgi:hypothetical protein
MIDPSIWSDSLVGSLSDPARILFIALISNADDEGRLEADALSLRRTAFGFRDVTVAQVEKWLAEIASTLRSVAVYQRDGRRYVELQNWLSYQTINRPTPSRIPAFRSEDSVSLQLSLIDDSLRTHGVLTEDSLPIEEKRSKEKGREEKGERAREASPRKPERAREIPTGTSELYDAVLAAMMLDHNCSKAAWQGVQKVVAVYAAKGRTAEYVKRQAEWFRTEHWIGKRGEAPSADNLIDTALQFEAATAPAAPKPKPPTPPPEVIAQVEARRAARIAKDAETAAKRQALQGGAR